MKTFFFLKKKNELVLLNFIVKGNDYKIGSIILWILKVQVERNSAAISSTFLMIITKIKFYFCEN